MLSINEIKNLKGWDLNKMTVGEKQQILKKAVDEQMRRFYRLERSGMSEYSPLYRGVQNELFGGDDKKVSSAFRKLYDWKVKDSKALNDKIKGIAQILSAESATSKGTRIQNKRAFDRIFKDSKSKITFKEWMENGIGKRYWETYERLKSMDYVASYGSDAVGSMITEFLTTDDDMDAVKIASALDEYRTVSRYRKGIDKSEFSSIT